jgi:hypothetical protein
MYDAQGGFPADYPLCRLKIVTLKYLGYRRLPAYNAIFYQISQNESCGMKVHLGLSFFSQKLLVRKKLILRMY